MKKRILSVMLVFVMILSQFSFAFANETKDYEKSWAKNDIMEWLDKGYITTYGDGSFKPKQNITRAEFVQVINKAFDIPQTEEIFEFTDVTTGHLFYEDIQRGKAFGYIGGYPDGSFKPEGYITREEASKIISVMLGVYKYNTHYTPEITDYDTIGDWAKEHVKFLIVKGSIKGYPDGSFKGKNNISRQEAVAILKRIHNVATSYTGIEVTAVDGESLIKNATVKLFTDEHNLIKEDISDESGYLAIKDIKPGSYFLIIEDENKEKVYSQKVVVKDNFTTFKQGQVQDAVKVNGLLVDQDGKKAPEDTVIVFASQSQFITHTLDKGMIETSLLANEKYTVFVKKDKLEKIGEISVEGVNKDIGTLKYIAKGGSSNNTGSNGSSTQPVEPPVLPEVPKVPGDSDNIPPVIELDIAQLEKYIDEDLYKLDEKLKDIKGIVVANSKITELKYRVDYGNLNIVENYLTPDNQFVLKELPLLETINTLTIEATDSNDNVGIYSIDIMNTSEENSVGVVLDEEDDDSDGLLNYQELYYGTDPNNPDTDGDGLTDYEEIMITLTDPLSIDTDGNGILDGDEDFDHDGLTNIEEMRLNGNPYNDDTDFDGLKDGKEAILGTKLDERDTDEDGLSDRQEIEFGTDPLNPDTNGNGILDGDEIYTIEKTPDIGAMDPNVVPTIKMDLPGNLIESLHISSLSENDIYLPSEMPGYIGAGYEFELSEEFEEATLTFTFNPKFAEIDNFEPAIYYYDEENQDMIMLENQIVDWENNKVSVQIEHFSKYILIDNTQYLEVWEQEIKKPSEEDLNKPLDIVLVIDSSGSMSWNDPDDIRKQVTKEFVDNLGEDDRVAVVDFDSYAYLLSPFTTDKEVAKTAIDRIDSRGGTSLTAGIRMALNQFMVSRQNFSRMALSNHLSIDKELGEDGLDIYGNPLLGEGLGGVDELKDSKTTEPSIQLFSMKPQINAYDPDSLKYIIMLTDGEGPYNKNLTQQAVDNEIVIHTVGLGNSLDVRLLNEIASQTGGKYFAAASAGDLIDEFTDIIGEVIEFSKDSDGDGLTDYYEKNLRYSNGIRIDTDPNNEDTDGDGLLDGEEIKVIAKEIERNGQKYMKVYAKMISHPKMIDTDGDGYSDYMEVKYNPHAGAGKYHPLKWDVSDRDLAIASKIAYDYLPIGNLDKLSSWKKEELNEKLEGIAKIEELGGWSVLDTWYSKGGLQMIALKNGENIIVACRGTDMKNGKWESFKDWYNNFTTYALGISTQTPAAKKFMNSTMDTNKGKRFYVTGHSLGGHLAYNAGAKGISHDIDSIKGIVTFNGLGLTLGLTLVGDLGDEKQLAKKTEIIRDYSVEADPVSKGFIGFTTFHYGEPITYKKSDKATDAHSMYTFLDRLKR